MCQQGWKDCDGDRASNGCEADANTAPSATYSCGKLLTYAVNAANGSVGVRCVKFTPDWATHTGLAFAWYGESRNGSGKYRNIGAATRNSNGTLTGSAADINGNGESGSSSTNLLAFSIDSALDEPPTIHMSGAWGSETWTKVAAHQCFGGLGLETKTCGSQLAKYRVYHRSNTISGHGVHCALGQSVWYAEGRMGNGKYANVGVNDSSQWGAFDLCRPGCYCGQTDFGGLTVTSNTFGGIGEGFVATNANLSWNEIWLPSTRRYAVRVHAIVATDVNGVHNPGMTSAQMGKWVAAANVAFANKGAESDDLGGVDFLFITDPDSMDYEVVENRALNTIKEGASDADWETYHLPAANYHAARFPDQLVAIVRWGDPTAAQGSSSAFGSPSMDFVVLPGYTAAASANCGFPETNSVLARAAGHYFGLQNTFAAAFASRADLQAFVNSNGLNALDGDTSAGPFSEPWAAITDTPTDPYNGEDNCGMATTVPVSVGAVTQNVPVDRTSLMSLWINGNGNGPKTISLEQLRAVHAYLKLRGLG